MTPPVNENKQERFRALQEKFARGLQANIEEMASLWQSVLLQSCDSSLGDALRRVVHGISGSAGTFGYAAISATVRRIEYLLYQCATEGKDPSVIRAQVDALIQEIEQLMPNGPDVVAVAPARIESQPNRSRLVYLIEDDFMLAEELSRQLEVFNWEIQCFGSAVEAIGALRKFIPAAIVVDIGMPEGELAGAKAIQQFLTSKLDTHLPSVFISSRYDWQARLAAARAGADIYLRKPFDGSELAAALLRLTEPEDEPYRILIVDDNEMLADHYASVLAGAGMQTWVLNDPVGLLAAIENYSPELVLMDVHMPGCSGMEAASVIRQDLDLIGLPIVYLSTEVEKANQTAAMRRGADDFLIKPISDQDLIVSVSTRATRFRGLASVMNRDSMTKLLNHSAIKNRLDSEYALATRSKQPLTFAMIDIDHFKKVNDSYGHPVGDRVIRSLSQLLKQRLRKYDVIGRYGGEEFAVILPNTTADQAKEVLNALREQFTHIVFRTQSDFTCSFSVGVAAVDDTNTVDEMIANADKALYASKAQGRNMVSVYVAAESID